MFNAVMQGAGEEALENLQGRDEGQGRRRRIVLNMQMALRRRSMRVSAARRAAVRLHSRLARFAASWAFLACSGGYRVVVSDAGRL